MLTDGEAVEIAAKSIAGADALLVTAGAGMGVDSGLPDFRGDRGFWRAYPAYEQLGLSFQELANPRWFRDDPALAWGFYGHRLNLYRATAPHAGFAHLLAWIAGRPRGGYVLTSNVDGQFQRTAWSPAWGAPSSSANPKGWITRPGPANWASGSISTSAKRRGSSGWRIRPC